MRNEGETRQLGLDAAAANSFSFPAQPGDFLLECGSSMSETDAEAHSDLATFGEELRKEREIRGISLKEIADATKVSRRFLEAI
jgi:hypothetical protein